MGGEQYYEVNIKINSTELPPHKEKIRKREQRIVFLIPFQTFMKKDNDGLNSFKMRLHCYAILSLFFILITNGTLYGQFPLFDGKQTSGIFAISYSGGSSTSSILPVSYDISKTKLKVSFQRAIKDNSVIIPIEGDITKDPQRWKPYKLRAIEFSVSLNEFNFDFLNAPNFDINLSGTPIGRRSNISLKKVYDGKPPDHILRRHFFNFSFKPSFVLSKKSNYLKQIAPDTFLVDNVVNYQLGLSSSVGIQVENDGSPEWAIGFNFYAGYSFDDLRGLSKREFCIESRTGTVNNSNASISKCSEILSGDLAGIAESVISLDYSRKIFGPFKSVAKSGTGEKLADFNNPSVHLLTRLQLEMKENAKPEYRGFLGLSLARVDRQIYASFLIDLIDLIENEDDDKDIFVETSNVSATISIPISN